MFSVNEEKGRENRATASEPKCYSGCQQSVHVMAKEKKEKKKRKKSQQAFDGWKQTVHEGGQVQPIRFV